MQLKGSSFVVTGGATFIFPMLEEFAQISLNLIQIPLKVESTPNRDGEIHAYSIQQLSPPPLQPYSGLIPPPFACVGPQRILPRLPDGALASARARTHARNPGQYIGAETSGHAGVAAIPL